MMNRETRELEEIKSHVAMLPPEQRAEVAKLLKQMKDVFKSASAPAVAAATIMLFSSIALAAKANAFESDTNETN